MILWPLFTYRRLERAGDWRLSVFLPSHRQVRYLEQRYLEGTVRIWWAYCVAFKLMVKA